MFGLIVIVIAVAYLLLSIAIVKIARRHAHKTGKNIKYWGWGAALVMWLIPFWDWLPTVAVHQYTCATEAGFWVYKTPEQWRRENPGVMEGLVNTSPGEYPNWPAEIWKDNKIYSVNQRFGVMYIDHLSSSTDHMIFPNVWRWKTLLLDKLNGDVIAQQIDFSSGNDGYIGGMHSMKFWLVNEGCRSDSERSREFGNLIREIGGKKK